MTLLLTPFYRRRLSRKALLWLLAAAAAALLLGFAVRSVLIRRMLLPRLAMTQGGSVIAVAITPDGKTIFSGSDPTHGAAHFRGNEPADVFVWESASGRLIHKLPGLYFQSNAVTASPDGKSVIAFGNTDREFGIRSHVIEPDSIVAWDWRSGQKLWAMPGSMPLSYAPDGRLIGCSDGIREAVTGKLVVKVPGGVEEDGQSAFSPDGSFFGFIGAATRVNNGFAYSDSSSDFIRYSNLVYSTTRLHLWRTGTGGEAKDFPFTRIRAFDIARNGKWLVMAADRDGALNGTDGSVVRRVDIQSGAVTWTRKRIYNSPDHDPDAVLNSVAVSPNGKYVVAQASSCQLIVLDAATGRELWRPYGSQSGMGSGWAIPGGMAFSQDGKTLVSRCGPRVLVWDTSSLQ